MAMTEARRKKKEYEHLVIPLRIDAGPAGLYPEPRVWMHGRDMAGFNAHFTYGFFERPAACHPVDGSMLVHPYDECLVFAGTDNTDMHHLGATVSVQLGEEGEEHIFDRPSVIVVPKGTPHGAVTIRDVKRPIAHYAFGLSPDYQAAGLLQRPKTPGTKHGHLIKRLITNVKRATDSSGMGYRRVIDETGVMRPAEMGVGPGNGDMVVWLYGDDVEGLAVNFTWGFYSKCGKWHRAGESHTHPEEEILVFVGLDPANLNYLGTEIEIGMGEDCERHIFNTPTVVVCPKAFPHLPVITRWVDKPYGFFVICLDGEHESPWVK